MPSSRFRRNSGKLKERFTKATVEPVSMVGIMIIENVLDASVYSLDTFMILELEQISPHSDNNSWVVLLPKDSLFHKIFHRLPTPQHHNNRSDMLGHKLLGFELDSLHLFLDAGPLLISSAQNFYENISKLHLLVRIFDSTPTFASSLHEYIFFSSRHVLSTKKMPCFRAMLVHLFGLCIISSNVLSVVASPIFHDGALLVPRADNHPGSEAISTVSHPTQVDKFQHSEDGEFFWDGDAVEDNYYTLIGSGQPDNEVEDLAIAIYQSKGRNTPESEKKYWLCVGMRCLRANKDPKAPSDLLSDVIRGRGTLQELKNFGKISFEDIEHKRKILVNFGEGQRHYFVGNSNPTNWDYLAALLRELRRQAAEAQLVKQEVIEQYMKEEAKKNLFG
ncbi:hypothetical protein EV368DRAFT_61700 [Lentinula lateritia]|uniref:Uncharacterized protein n=1 Tax=Lentinula aff. lateritia TaxID=2804960 RepID=A0ACC1U6M3_9AGAR|nr:hypothetical protein F5876DRAFT_63783 [Lentinula aff. lateritia]KAJ3856409.1 hypothetical protein EV368DRAFT_61700 [Lentinula lateritia]